MSQAFVFYRVNLFFLNEDALGGGRAEGQVWAGVAGRHSGGAQRQDASERKLVEEDPSEGLLSGGLCYKIIINRFPVSINPNLFVIKVRPFKAICVLLHSSICSIISDFWQVLDLKDQLRSIPGTPLCASIPSKDQTRKLKSRAWPERLKRKDTDKAKAQKGFN